MQQPSYAARCFLINRCCNDFKWLPATPRLAVGLEQVVVAKEDASCSREAPNRKLPAKFPRSQKPLSLKNEA